MSSNQQYGENPGKRGFWKWLAGAALLMTGGAVAILLFADDTLKPYDDLKAADTPVPDVRTNGFLYIKERWAQREMPSKDRSRLAAMTRGREPADAAFVEQLRNGYGRPEEDWRTALDMPDWRMPADLLDAPYYGGWLIKPVLLFKFDAMASLRSGDPGPAVTLQQEIMLASNRTLVGCSTPNYTLTALNLRWIAEDLVCEVLGSGKQNSGQLDAMSALWRDDPEIADAWWRALWTEGIYWRSMMEREFSNAWQAGQGRSFKDILRHKVKFKKNRSLNAYNEILREQLRFQIQPYPDYAGARAGGIRGWQENEFPQLDKLDTSGGSPLRDIGYYRSLALSLYPYLFNSRAVRVWLAVTKWRQIHPGQWPATLAELVPDYLPEVPKDPWNGASVMWNQATRTVYAVGWDWEPDQPVYKADGNSKSVNHKWFSPDTKAPGLRMELPPEPETSPGAAAQKASKAAPRNAPRRP